MKVLVGMSGGVDSSVAALLLKREGFYEVEGFSLMLYETRGTRNPKACCGLDAVLEAKKTAKRLGIPHRVADAREIFMEKVIEPFTSAYAAGLTPNPCILCNRHIKFPLLMEEAGRAGFALIATGHYARVERNQDTVLLKKAIDSRKDQSYVLYAQRKQELERLVLPLGEFRKHEVREMAREAGLSVFGRPESQEICFVQGRDYFPLVTRLAPASAREGPIVDESGAPIGTHKGIGAYTIGQRKGLGVSSPEGALYVYRIDPKTNTIYAGAREKALVRGFEAGDINWLSDEKTSEFGAEVKVRSMMKPARALIRPAGDSMRVFFDEPQWAPAPGQSAVFYEGDTVIGGGIIKTFG